jgi:hypothetical protein
MFGPDDFEVQIQQENPPAFMLSRQYRRHRMKSTGILL